MSVAAESASRGVAIPQTGRFLTAEWRSLVMLNWAVDPALLRSRVPRGTRLDLWHDTAFVSVVGFLFLRTRLLGIPIPLHRSFEEVNLRFYVGRQGEEGWRRGVCFVRELVPRRAVATLARLTYNEPYRALPMRHRVELGEQGGWVEYGWRSGAEWSRLHASALGAAALPAPGSQPEFITEHYWGYTAQRDGGTVEYRVEHPPWRVWQAHASGLEADVAALYGADFVPVLSTDPVSAFIAEGSPVTVRRPRRVA